MVTDVGAGHCRDSHPTYNTPAQQAAIQDSDFSKGHPGTGILNFASNPPDIHAAFATALPLHTPFQPDLRPLPTMAAPVEQRIAVPIDDPNADTEW